MQMTIELVGVPVTDIDRAKAFYVDQLGFVADHDHQVDETLRFVQLTPPGSGCSISFVSNWDDMAPGSLHGALLCVEDIDAARADLIAKGVDCTEVATFDWGKFAYFADPDGNSWGLQEKPTY